jgi:hypothetical protein
VITSILPLWGADRVANATAVLQSWHLAPGDSRLIVVEREGPPMLKDYGKAERVAFPVPADKWPKAVLMNAAARLATGRIHFHDCDVPIPPGWYERAEAHGADCFTGYTDFWYLDGADSQRARDMLAAGENVIPFRSGRHFPIGGCGAGGMFVISRDLFERVGDWLPLGSWGFEDVDYVNRCRKVLGYCPGDNALPGEAVHLWHKRCDKTDADKNREIVRSRNA